MFRWGLRSGSGGNTCLPSCSETKALQGGYHWEDVQGNGGLKSEGRLVWLTVDSTDKGPEDA